MKKNTREIAEMVMMDIGEVVTESLHVAGNLSLSLALTKKMEPGLKKFLVSQSLYWGLTIAEEPHLLKDLKVIGSKTVALSKKMLQKHSDLRTPKSTKEEPEDTSDPILNTITKDVDEENPTILKAIVGETKINQIVQELHRDIVQSVKSFSKVSTMPQYEGMSQYNMTYIVRHDGIIGDGDSHFTKVEATLSPESPDNRNALIIGDGMLDEAIRNGLERYATEHNDPAMQMLRYHLIRMDDGAIALLDIDAPNTNNCKDTCKKVVLPHNDDVEFMVADIVSNLWKFMRNAIGPRHGEITYTITEEEKVEGVAPLPIFNISRKVMSDRSQDIEWDDKAMKLEPEEVFDVIMGDLHNHAQSNGDDIAGTTIRFAIDRDDAGNVALYHGKPKGTSESPKTQDSQRENDSEDSAGDDSDFGDFSAGEFTQMIRDAKVGLGEVAASIRDTMKDLAKSLGGGFSEKSFSTISDVVPAIRDDILQRADFFERLLANNPNVKMVRWDIVYQVRRDLVGDGGSSFKPVSANLDIPKNEKFTGLIIDPGHLDDAIKHRLVRYMITHGDPVEQVINCSLIRLLDGSIILLDTDGDGIHPATGIDEIGDISARTSVGGVTNMIAENVMFCITYPIGPRCGELIYRVDAKKDESGDYQISISRKYFSGHSLGRTWKPIEFEDTAVSAAVMKELVKLKKFRGHLDHVVIMFRPERNPDGTITLYHGHLEMDPNDHQKAGSTMAIEDGVIGDHDAQIANSIDRIKEKINAHYGNASTTDAPQDETPSDSTETDEELDDETLVMSTIAEITAIMENKEIGRAHV